LLDQASDDVLTENYVAFNLYGAQIASSSNNILFHNSFDSNSYQCYSKDSISVWDDGYPSGGNYWSDYQYSYPDATELENSEIWNTPYVIDENNQDNYPLMKSIT
jgi:parallel beta-helix repeat protein